MARTCKEPVLLKHPLLGRYDSSPRKASLWRKVLHLLGEMELDVYSCKAGITACASVVGFRFFFWGGRFGSAVSILGSTSGCVGPKTF